MAVIDHDNTAWVLGDVVHNDWYDSAFLLSVKGLLSKFTVISSAQNDFFCFLRVWNVFIDTILEDGRCCNFPDNCSSIRYVSKVGKRIGNPSGIDTILIGKILFQTQRTPDYQTWENTLYDQGQNAGVDDCYFHGFNKSWNEIYQSTENY